MGVYESLPYVNFHEINLDWLLKRVRQVAEETARTSKRMDDVEELVQNFIDTIDIPAEVRIAINEMIDDGRMGVLIEDELNKALKRLPAEFLTPQRYKTDENSWDTAFASMFEAARQTGQKIIIPQGTYELTRAFYADSTMVISDAGNYTNQKIYTTGGSYVFTDYHDFKYCRITPDLNNQMQSGKWGVQGGCYNSVLNRMAAIVYDANESVQWLVEYDMEYGKPVRAISLGAYTNGGKIVTFNPDDNVYVIADTNRPIVRRIDSATEVISEVATNNHIPVMIAYDKQQKIYYYLTRSDYGYMLDRQFNEIGYFNAININDVPETGFVIQDMDVWNGNLYILYDWQYKNHRNGHSVYRFNPATASMECVYSAANEIPEASESQQLIFINDCKWRVVLNDDFDQFIVHTHGNAIGVQETLAALDTVHFDGSVYTNGDGTAEHPYNVLDGAYRIAQKYGKNLTIRNMTLNREFYINGYNGIIYMYAANTIRAKFFITNSKITLYSNQDAGNSWMMSNPDGQIVLENSDIAFYNVAFRSNNTVTPFNCKMGSKLKMVSCSIQPYSGNYTVAVITMDSGSLHLNQVVYTSNTWLAAGTGFIYLYRGTITNNNSYGVRFGAAVVQMQTSAPT